MPSAGVFYVTVRGCPKSINAGGVGSRSHWSVGYKEKKCWQETFEMAFLERRIPKRMSFCLLDVTVRFKHRNVRDEENFRPSVVKPLADALVNGGWLRDDTSEFLKVSSFEFEFPETWAHADPRVKAEIGVQLAATYG